MESAPSESKIQNPSNELRNDLINSTRPKDLMRTSQTETKGIVSAEENNTGVLLREAQKHLEAQHAEQLHNNQQLQGILGLLKNETPERENTDEPLPETRDKVRIIDESIRNFRKNLNSLLDAAPKTDFDSLAKTVDQLSTNCTAFEDEFFKLIVSRASEEENRSMTYLYAKICQLVLRPRMQPTFVSKYGKRGSLRSFDSLLRRIELKLEITMNALAVEQISDSSKSNSSTMRKKHKQNRILLSGRLDRLLRFVGRLYNLSVLDFFTIMSVLSKLLDFSNESVVEIICDFCETNVEKLFRDNKSAFVKWNAKPCQLTEFQQFLLKSTIEDFKMLEKKFPLNDKIRIPLFCYEQRWW